MTHASVRLKLKRAADATGVIDMLNHNDSIDRVSIYRKGKFLVTFVCSGHKVLSKH
jgi:putative component of toxin-antitoxin plasmid stabilization module